MGNSSMMSGKGGVRCIIRPQKEEAIRSGGQDWIEINRVPTGSKSDGATKEFPGTYIYHHL